MGVLAINGGPKTYSGKINSQWPVFGKKDLDGLTAVLGQAKQGGNGPMAKKFEKRFSAYNDVKHTILCANGTTAIELVLRGLGIGWGDEVIVPSHTFIASVSAILYAGATPVFADIEPDTCNLCPKNALSKITPRTKAVMPVYVGGRPADIDAFNQLAEETGIYFIGDAAQAAGAGWRGKGIGGFGIASTFSCQKTKNLNCGEGGIITTNDDKLAADLRTIINGGMGPDGSYTHIGLHHGVSEFQASILYSQMDNLDEQTAYRMENAAYLDSLLAPLPFVSSMKADERITKNAYHLYIVRFHEEHLDGISYQRFLQAVQAEGVGITGGYTPLYHNPSVKNEYSSKIIGNPMDLNPGNKVDEQLSYHEIGWFFQSILLNDKAAIKAIADAMIKVYEHRVELRGETNAVD